VPHSVSARKRVRQNEKRRLYNKSIRTSIRTQIKRVRTAVEAGDKEAAEKELVKAVKLLDKAVSKGVVHKNTAARVKSRLTKHVNDMAPAPAEQPS